MYTSGWGKYGDWVLEEDFYIREGTQRGTGAPAWEKKINEY